MARSSSSIRGQRRHDLMRAAQLILKHTDANPQREGLRDTPERFARMWEEFADYDPGNMDTTFKAERSDQMVVVSPIRVWSFCEHHLLPFWCDLSIGYITHGDMLGLSKFARIANNYAHSLQVQEKLVEQIADYVVRAADTRDVAVLGRGEHLCMTMRGIRCPALMSTSITRGVFRHSEAARLEFMRLANVK